MKKFFSLMLVALVMLGVTACEQNVTIDTPKSEGLSFYAEIAMTRADLEQGTDGKWATVWEGNETLYVNEFEFTNTEAEPSKFTCTTKGVANLVGEDVTIKMENNSVPESGKGIMIEQTIESFNPESTISLTAKNAFLRFYYVGEAKFTLSEPLFVVNNATTDTITVTANGNTWVSVLPGTADLTFEGSSNDESKSKTEFVMNAGMIYNLGTLSVFNIGLVGSFQGWNVESPVSMKASNRWYVASGVELYKNDEFKFVKDNSWDVSYGGNGAVLVAEASKEYTLTSKDGKNIKVTKNGKFDIYFNPVTLDFKYECVEEYADLTVDITIDNKANWSPLYITLKSGESVIVNEATVTDNKYPVSGDYIGESLSYTLSNGSKTVEGNVSITKDGATIILEETVIKLKVTLDTDNSKQWWGNTMKIHVWETGTSFDTSWPGNVMTSEGNYTWSIVVPSELVGKTIKYLVHNGNGWQSSDATVTIAAEGNTVTGSSIGIN